MSQFSLPAIPANIKEFCARWYLRDETVMHRIVLTGWLPVPDSLDNDVEKLRMWYALKLLSRELREIVLLWEKLDLPKDPKDEEVLDQFRQWVIDQQDAIEESCG